ncbi:hypothetical protein [Streptomyces californicus]|uniref:hypothetical protein n=1 Tax=Streptomyces californicus TaxID=67351 RepID=UPI00296ECCBA|nr:hypothetical protein [Streptomyces californicus]MDW4918610.1 hypothetical protein [Streptomyces californicus]
MGKNTKAKGTNKGTKGPLFTKQTPWETLWLPEPEPHNFPAAHDYLGLLFDKKTVAEAVANLEAAKTRVHKAKDLLRASGSALLPAENLHVRKNIEKVMRGKKLSPVLLLRRPEGLIIADGYHRVCAAYYLTEDLSVPARLT